MPLHPFYPIVPDADWIARIVPLGVKLVQLRIKNEPDQVIRHQIAQSLEICKTHQCQLVVNDHWRAALDLGADFIHLGQEDMAQADLSAIRRAGCRLGVSTHDDTELQTALNAKPDYIALGPVYETSLKKMKWSPQGLARVKSWKAAADCPLVAIGGITLDRAAGVLAAGADSVAVVTDIVFHSTPEQRVEHWLVKLHTG